MLRFRGWPLYQAGTHRTAASESPRGSGACGFQARRPSCSHECGRPPHLSSNWTR
jgi:hypothetical protein